VSVSLFIDEAMAERHSMVQIESATTIVVNDVKSKWSIPTDKLVQVDGLQFLKLPRSPNTVCAFARMVMAPLSRGKGESMSCSIGYKALLEARNKAQAAHLVSDVPDCFQAFKEPSASKKQRVARADIKAAREAPASVTLTIPAFGEFNPMDIKVLRPVNNRDDLSVEVDSSVIERLILYFRDTGFSTDAMPYRQRQGGQKGVYRRTDQRGLDFFIVRSSGGTLKKCSTVEEASNALDDGTLAIENGTAALGDASSSGLVIADADGDQDGDDADEHAHSEDGEDCAGAVPSEDEGTSYVAQSDDGARFHLRDDSEIDEAMANMTEDEA
jgi:hypothetical protein